MTRRNPDAVALCVLGAMMLLGSIPGMLLRQAEWGLHPLKMEMRIPQRELRELRDNLHEQRDEIRKEAEELKRSLRNQ